MPMKEPPEANDESSGGGRRRVRPLREQRASLIPLALLLLLLSRRRCSDAFVVVPPSSSPPLAVQSRSGSAALAVRGPGYARPAAASSAALPRPSTALFAASASSSVPADEDADSDRLSSGPLGWIRSNRPADRKNRLTMGLAFLTGWADVALVAKFKTFATMMTGNTMWMASAAVDGRIGDVGYYASIILCYSLGLAGFRRAELSLRNKSLTFVCAPLVTALFCAADYLSWVDPARRWPPMMMLGAAFGIINSVGTEMAGTLAFVLTGHMTKLTNLIVDRFSRTAGRKRVVDTGASAAIRSASVIAAFFGGALWACGMFKAWPRLIERGNFAILGTLFGSLFLWQDRDTLGAWWKREDGDMCQLDDLETICT